MPVTKAGRETYECKRSQGAEHEDVLLRLNSSSHVTLSWSKGDSNSPSHPERQRSEGRHMGPAHRSRFRSRAAVIVTLAALPILWTPNVVVCAQGSGRVPGRNPRRATVCG